MPDKSIWSFANQFVIFEHARLQTPLLAENPHRRGAHPKRTDKKRDGDHEQQKFKPTTKGEDRQPRMAITQPHESERHAL